MMIPALLSAVLLLLLLPAAPAERSNQTHFTIVVMNVGPDNQTYSTYVVYRGILLGGMKRLRDSNAGFNFTYTENPDYGPFLKSVNGLAGKSEEHTYWELLVQKPNGRILRSDIGIGCYIPSANDKVILKYSRY